MEGCHVIIFHLQNRNPNFPQTLAATMSTATSMSSTLPKTISTLHQKIHPSCQNSHDHTAAQPHIISTLPSPSRVHLHAATTTIEDAASPLLFSLQRWRELHLCTSNQIHSHHASASCTSPRWRRRPCRKTHQQPSAAQLPREGEVCESKP